MKNPAEFARTQPMYSLLHREEQEFWLRICNNYQLSQTEASQLLIMIRDCSMWGNITLEKQLAPGFDAKIGKQEKKRVLALIKSIYEELKLQGQEYDSSPITGLSAVNTRFIEMSDERTIMGNCPVASVKTRCCNLHTLDAVFRCGFDCSYCSIQSFYDDGKISFHRNLSDKLDALQLDSDTRYHIGTGQSSDSLMWGNKDGLLENLMDFAGNHPNIILELKTKSGNVAWLLENTIPENVVVTWSLNTDTIIANEEHRTASLNERLSAARACADAGIPIGFHFHPMVHYKNWDLEYRELFERIHREFKPAEIVLISLGTLTYIKPVLKKIRNRDFKTAILRMPMEEIGGKYSYPIEIKHKLFSLAMDILGDWKADIFFYLCMEDHSLWKPLFGRDYENNEEFERDMLDWYFKKCSGIRRSDG